MSAPTHLFRSVMMEGVKGGAVALLYTNHGTKNDVDEKKKGGKGENFRKTRN